MDRKITITDVCKVRKQKDIKGLVEIAESDQNTAGVRRKAVEALGVISSDISVQALLDFTKHDNPIIRHASMKALKRVTKTYRDLVIKALIAALDDSNHSVIKEAISSMVEIGNIRFVKPLVNLLKTADDEHLLYCISEVFADMKNKAPRRKAALLLMELFKENNPNLEYAAIALQLLRDPAVLTNIRSYFKEENNENIRLNALIALLGYGVRTTGTVIKATVDTNPEVAEVAIANVNEFSLLDDDYDTLATYKQDLKSNDAELVFSAALFLSYEEGDQESIDVLLEYLQDPNPIIRVFVINHLGHFGYERSTPALQQALESEKDEHIKESIKSALSRIASITARKRSYLLPR